MCGLYGSKRHQQGKLKKLKKEDRETVGWSWYHTEELNGRKSYHGCLMRNLMKRI